MDAQEERAREAFALKFPGAPASSYQPRTGDAKRINDAAGKATSHFCYFVRMYDDTEGKAKELNSFDDDTVPAPPLRPRPTHDAPSDITRFDIVAERRASRGWGGQWGVKEMPLSLTLAPPDSP